MATVSLQSAFDAARRALDAGTADKAIAVARHILAQFPRNIEAQRLLGEALLNAGEAEAAAEAFERVLDADPESVAAYYGRGLAFAARDDRLNAVRAFERALEIQPNLAELRTQLIRLYGEAPGSSPQLRLSRAGLARLYTRGGMYGQAVDEFRAIEAESDRPDVEAALAEALWRDGQEDEAAAYCRDTLERRPDLLKPRLLLGYLLFAGGKPEGEELWRSGAQQDPTLTVARGLFDILPPIRLEDPTLPAFDADELVARGNGAARAEPARSITSASATELSSPAVEQPVEQPSTGDQDAAFADIAAASEQEAVWSANETDYPADDRQPESPPRDMLSDDALLASLLGIDQPPEQPAGLAARSPGVPAAGQAPLAQQPEIQAGEPALQAESRPFLLDEADAVDIAAFSLDQASGDETPAQGLENAGGPDDDMAFFEIGEQSRSESSDATPFDVLPASSEVLDYEGPSGRPQAAEPPPEAQPTRDLFSLDDLADDTASWEQEQPVSSGDEEKMPFSLADLGIDAEDLNAIPSGSPISPARTDQTPLLGWEAYDEFPESPQQDVAGAANDIASPETVSRASTPAAAPAGRQSEAASFSLADLGLTDEEIAALDLHDVELADEEQQPAGQATAQQPGPPVAPTTSRGASSLGSVRSVFQQLEAEPDNAALRLAVARFASQSGEAGQALEHYRQLVRGGKLLDDVTGDLQDLIDEHSDPHMLRRLHRLLGDAFMKQNRVQEAMEHYSWTSEP